MTEHDDLRVRLARLDPAAHALEPVESPRAPELLERIMATPVLSEHNVEQRPRRPRRALVAGLAAASLAVGAVAVGVALRNGGGTTKDPTTLALSLPPSNVMSSCVVFDVQFLKGMSPAFGGTVTELDDTHVVIDVDKWYTGGSADQVSLAIPAGNTSASLDGVQFEKGKRYLVTASDGTVNGCGFSGPATPELEKSFQEAFGG